MKNLKIPVLNYLLVILVSTSIISCSEDGAEVNGADRCGANGTDFTNMGTMFENKSNLKPLVTMFRV
jgi:hypothetical protein